MSRTTLLLTRPDHSARRFAEGLSAAARAAVDIVISPLIEIVPTAADWTDVQAAGVIFTSANAIGFADIVNRPPAYCVGARTAEMARDAGWPVQATFETAEALIAGIAQAKPAGPLLHVAGHHRRGAIAQRLTALGLPTREIVVYDQVARDLDDKARGALAGVTIAPLFSPRTALQFARQDVDLSKVHVIALSEAVASPLAGRTVSRIEVVPAPTGDMMRQAVEKRCTGPTMA